MNGGWFALAAAAGLGFAVGLLAGGAYFAALWWSVRRLRAGGAWRLAGLQLLRFALLGAVLFALARIGGSSGAAALLASLPGLLLARGLLARRIGRAA